VKKMKTNIGAFNWVKQEAKPGQELYAYLSEKSAALSEAKDKLDDKLDNTYGWARKTQGIPLVGSPLKLGIDWYAKREEKALDRLATDKDLRELNKFTTGVEHAAFLGLFNPTASFDEIKLGSKIVSGLLALGEIERLRHPIGKLLDFSKDKLKSTSEITQGGINWALNNALIPTLRFTLKYAFDYSLNYRFKDKYTLTLGKDVITIADMMSKYDVTQLGGVPRIIRKSSLGVMLSDFNLPKDILSKLAKSLPTVITKKISQGKFNQIISKWSVNEPRLVMGKGVKRPIAVEKIDDQNYKV